MALTSAIATYFVMWWIVLFVVLPFGVKSQIEEGAVNDGTEPGAPVLAGMGRKLIWTTIITTIIFTVFAIAYNLGLFENSRLTRLLGLPI